MKLPQSHVAALLSCQMALKRAIAAAADQSREQMLQSVLRTSVSYVRHHVSSLDASFPSANPPYDYQTWINDLNNATSPLSLAHVFVQLLASIDPKVLHLPGRPMSHPVLDRLVFSTHGKLSLWLLGLRPTTDPRYSTGAAACLGGSVLGVDTAV